MTTLADLCRPVERTVETPSGSVVVRSAPFEKLAEFIDGEPTDQAAHLIAVCAVDPPMTVEEARLLPPFVVMPLMDACMEINGLSAPD